MSCATQEYDNTVQCRFRLRGYHPLGLSFPEDSANELICICASYERHHLTTPMPEGTGLGFFRFARRY